MSSEELKRYWHKPGIGFAVLDPQYYEDESGYVAYEDYAALEAELERRKQLDQEALEFRQELIRERDDALAQLAAIQGGMGEEVEVVAWRIEHPVSQWKVYEQRQDWAYQQYGHIKYQVQDLMTVAQHQRITAAMAAEAERLKAEVTRWHTLACNHSRAEDQLRAELAEVKGREAVATIEQREPYEDGTPNPCKTLCWVGDNAEDDLPAGTKLYTTPPASPDVEGLVKALEATLKLGRGTSGRIILESEDEEALRTALSTWRQAHTPSTLPASSAEE